MSAALEGRGAEVGRRAPEGEDLDSRQLRETMKRR